MFRSRELWIVALIISLISLSSSVLAVSSNLEIANEYIRIVVNTSENNMGRFSVGTTGGDPDRTGDENKHLIYGGNEPWTSFTTIRIGNQNWIYGQPTNRRAGRDGQYGSMISAPTIIDNTIVSAWQTGPIEITQRLGFARSTTTGLQDSARIEYELHNTDTVTHFVGLRIMLDTMLGQNDGAPFRVNDQGLVTDSVFYSHEMPEFWQAFDSISNPQVMAQGTLRGGEVSTPDRVYFTNWGSLADYLWNFDFQPGRDYTRKGEFELDSAIALFWDPTPLQPGESRNYVAYYGLGGVTVAPGDLSLGVTSPAQITADATHRQSFPIIAYIQNTGKGEARDVIASIKLPVGLILLEGNPTRNLGNLDVGETLQTSWQVIPTGDFSGTLTYEVEVEAINSESNRVKRDIEIVTPAKLQIDLRGPFALSIVNERLTPVPIEITAIIRNIGGSPAHRLKLTLDHPIGLTLAAGERSQKYTGSLNADEEISINWYLEPTGVAGNLPYSLRVRSSTGEQVVNNFVLLPNLSGKVWFDAPITYRENTIHPGEYFSVTLWATNIRNFQKATLELGFNPDVVDIVGHSLDISPGTLFIDDSIQPARPLAWQRPIVDNRQGTVSGIIGDRGEDKVLALAYGSLITIHFRAKDVGNAELTINNLKLYDSQGQIINAQTSDREIVVYPR